MANRLYLPKIIKVGGVDFDVMYPAELRGGSMEKGIFGMCDYFQGKIYIFKDVIGYYPPPEKIIDVLIHETIHAVDEVWLDNIMEEEEVNRLGRSLYQVLVDNDLSPIPPTVKVAGMFYSIEFVNYSLDDSERSNIVSSCNNLTNEIYIRNENNGELYSEEYVYASFLRAVLCAIAYEYGFSEEFQDKVNVTTLAYGLQHLLKYNDFEGLIKKYCR